SRSFLPPSNVVSATAYQDGVLSDLAQQSRVDGRDVGWCRYGHANAGSHREAFGLEEPELDGSELGSGGLGHHPPDCVVEGELNVDLLADLLLSLRPKVGERKRMLPIVVPGFLAPALVIEHHQILPPILLFIEQ